MLDTPSGSVLNSNWWCHLWVMGRNHYDPSLCPRSCLLTDLAVYFIFIRLLILQNFEKRNLFFSCDSFFIFSFFVYHFQSVYVFFVHILNLQSIFFPLSKFALSLGKLWRKGVNLKQIDVQMILSLPYLKAYRTSSFTNNMKKTSFS